MKTILYAILLALAIAIPIEVGFWGTRYVVQHEDMYTASEKSTCQVRSDEGGYGQGVAITVSGKTMILTAGHVVDACHGHPTVVRYGDDCEQTWTVSRYFMLDGVDLAVMDGIFDMPPVAVMSHNAAVGDECFTFMNGYGEHSMMFPFVVSGVGADFMAINGDGVPGFSGSCVFHGRKLAGILTTGHTRLKLMGCYNASSVRDFIDKAEKAYCQ